ncbi:MAG: metal ABC transporter permease, partial [Flavobacteriales bacterium]|nr:metal ABC transporter permease [Flavobacteriales bacterium]
MDALLIILTAALLAGSNGLLGNYLVLRKEVMLGDAISHAILPGLVIGFMISGSLNSIPMLIGSSLAGFVCILLIQALQNAGKMAKDASIGMSFSLLFSIGIILINRYVENVNLDADCVLNGEIGYIILKEKIHFLGLALPYDTWLALSLFILISLLLVIFHKPLQISSFDRDFAHSLGIKSKRWDLFLLFTVTLTTVVSFESIGAVLVVAFLAIPPATAYLITKSYKSMVFWSLIFSVGGCVL